MPEIDLLVRQIEELDPVERERLWVSLVNSSAGVHGQGSGWPASPWWPQSFVPDYPSIVKTPDVCGGAARLIRTRIPVWTIERMRQLGSSEADILHGLPSLRASDLVQVWAYVDRHRGEIEDVIRDNEEA